MAGQDDQNNSDFVFIALTTEDDKEFLFVRYLHDIDGLPTGISIVLPSAITYTKVQVTDDDGAALPAAYAFVMTGSDYQQYVFRQHYDSGGLL